MLTIRYRSIRQGSIHKHQASIFQPSIVLKQAQYMMMAIQFTSKNTVIIAYGKQTENQQDMLQTIILENQ